MRILWLLGLTTGCGYISDAKYGLRLDPDNDGVSIEEDCDNTDANLGSKRTFYMDADGDGFGDPDVPVEACTLPEDASENSLDCDDTRADVNPGMDDVFYDGVDSDCDGSNDCDADGDGFDGSAEGGLPTEECPNASDCNDSDPEVRPMDGATEVQFNGEDDDCNVLTGDGDFDGDGFWHANYEEIVLANGLTPMEIPEGKGGDCYDWSAEPVEGFDPSVINGFGDFLQPTDVHPDAAETWYDGVDQNCDGLNDFDQDGDGFSTSEYPNREGVVGLDCLDEGEVFGVAAVDVNPDAEDAWYDGVDSDCAGNNDFDQDGDGELVSSLDCDSDGNEETECDFDNDGSIDFLAGSDCNDQDAGINISAEEVPVDGVDQNCNGFELCYADDDGDGFGLEETQSPDLTCTIPGLSVNDLDCDDAVATVYPGATEICDGLKNDCDASELPSVEDDFDNDTYVECSVDSSGWAGASSVVGGQDCNPVDATVYPGAPELVDGLDNDCDSALSAEESDLDGDGYISGTYNANAWFGDSNVTGGDDCNDGNAMQYPGAASADSQTACLLDADGDGYAEPGEYCFQLELMDMQNDGWQSTSIEVVVDGQVEGVYEYNLMTGNTPYTVCTYGLNIDVLASFIDPTVAEASVNILDSDGMLLGSGMGQGDVSWIFEGNVYDAAVPFWTIENPNFGSDCDDGDSMTYPTAPEQCDGVINDCNQTVLPPDEVDLDGDLYVECVIEDAWLGDSSILDGGGGDCEPNDPAINPGVSEVSDDGIDNNCDGAFLTSGGGGAAN